MTAMRHPEVHRVRPQWGIVQGRSDSRIVEESLLLHHGELIIATNSQVRSPHSNYTVISQVGVLLSDDPHSSHLLGPVVNGSV